MLVSRGSGGFLSVDDVLYATWGERLAKWSGGDLVGFQSLSPQSVDLSISCVAGVFHSYKDSGSVGGRWRFCVVVLASVTRCYANGVKSVQTCVYKCLMNWLICV